MPQALKRRKNIPWSKLLARVFGIDVETCLKCAGKIKIIASIEEPEVIGKILTHLGVATTPRSFHPATGPPELNPLEQNPHLDEDFS